MEKRKIISRIVCKVGTEIAHISFRRRFRFKRGSLFKSLMKFVRLLFISRPSLSISGDIHVGFAFPSRLHLRVRIRRKFHRRAGRWIIQEKFLRCSCNERAALPAHFSYRAPLPFLTALLFLPHPRNIPRIAVFRRVILARSAKKSRDVPRGNSPLLLASKFINS